MSLDLGTLTVKLAADVAELKKGLAQATAETKKSADTMRSLGRSAAGAFDGVAGVLQGLGHTVKKTTKAVGDIFGKDATAQGQRWGREIQAALGLTGDQVKGLEQSMRGLDGALEIVGQSMGLIKSAVGWLVTGGVIAVAAFTAAFVGVIAAIGAASRYSDDLKNTWKELKTAWSEIWKTEEDPLGKFLNWMVDNWAKSIQLIIKDLQALESAKRTAFEILGLQKNIDLGPDAGKKAPSTTQHILSGLSNSVEASRAAFGSKEGREDTFAKTIAAYATVGKAFVEDAKLMGADLKKSFDEGKKVLGLDKVWAGIKGLGKLKAGTSPEEQAKQLKEREAWNDVANKEYIEWQKYTLDESKEDAKKILAYWDEENKKEDMFHRLRMDKIAQSAQLRNERMDEIGGGSFLKTTKRDASGVVIQHGALGDSGAGAAMGGAINSLTSSIAQGAKTVGATLQGFAEGMKSGNIWGAIIGAIGGLLSQSRGFALIMSVLESSFKSLSDVLGGVFLMLGPFIQIGDVITQVLGQVLVPVFKYFATILSIFYPIVQGVTIVVAKVAQGLGWLFNNLLELVGGVLVKVSPIVNSFGQAVGWMATALADVANWITGAVASVFTGIGRVVQAITGVVARVVNGITSALGWIIGQIAGFLSGIEILGARPFAGIANTMQGFSNSLRANTLDENSNAVTTALEDFAAKAKSLQIPPDVIEEIRNKIVSGIGWEAGKLPAKISEFVAGFEVDTGKLSAASKLAIDSTWERVMADMKAKDAAMALSESAKEASESLTNIPSGYRVSAARFGASLPKFAEGGFVSQPTAAIVGDSPGGEYIVPAGKMGSVTININGAGDPRAVAREVAAILERRRALGGSSLQLAPGYTG